MKFARKWCEMKTPDDSFLGSYRDKFKIGDLVFWYSWEEDESYKILTVVNRGAIIDIIDDYIGLTKRKVCMAVVLPFGETQVRMVHISSLRKQD